MEDKKEEERLECWKQAMQRYHQLFGHLERMKRTMASNKDNYIHEGTIKSTLNNLANEYADAKTEKARTKIRDRAYRFIYQYETLDEKRREWSDFFESTASCVIGVREGRIKTEQQQHPYRNPFRR